MKEIFRKFATAYFSGALGGLAYAGAAWLCGNWHLYSHFHVQMAMPTFTWAYLAGRILDGSLWALLIVLLSPLLKAQGAMLGLVLSLIPSAYVLLIYYPYHGYGLFGNAKGVLTFMFVLIFYAAWGLITGMLYSSEYKS